MVSKYLLDLKSTHVGGGRNWDTTNESSQGIKPYDIETIIQSFMNSNQQHRGRIQTHQCATEDTAPIIGGSTAVSYTHTTLPTTLRALLLLDAASTQLNLQ